MQEIINESILPMVNDGKLSMEKINQLIYIKEFVDRIATKNYIGIEAIDKIKVKYGVMPSVITWGDYFQSELATNLHHLSDEEFTKSINTVKFDMLASYTIFSEKEKDFFDWVENTYNEIMCYKSDRYSEEEEEVIHLKILMDYYNDIGITNNFTETELKWLESFSEATAI